MKHRMLIMNMGSTSTKVAVYEDTSLIWKEGISHPREDISRYLGYMDQYAYRRSAIEALVAEKGEQMQDFTVFISRGGTVRPIPGGTWRIGPKMLEDSQSGKYGEHPCNIGGQIAYDLAQEYNREALTVDPPICDEMRLEATFSGLPGIERKASFQALNHRATARKYAEDVGKPYAELNLIVAHMGGGVSVAAHRKGKIIDVNNALAGDGPFALERSGDLPVGDLIELCYSNKYTLQEMHRLVNGRGGVYAYLGTTDGLELDKRIQNADKDAEQVVRAMAYQIGKEIGGLMTVFDDKVDAILLTAGLAYWDYFVDLVRERVEFLAPVHVYPGENEMEALALGVYRYFSGEESAFDYELYAEKADNLAQTGIGAEFLSGNVPTNTRSPTNFPLQPLNYIVRSNTKPYRLLTTKMEEQANL